MTGKYGINEINKKFNRKFQELCSYKLIFKFKTDAGILNYLNNKEIGNEDIYIKKGKRSSKIKNFFQKLFKKDVD